MAAWWGDDDRKAWCGSIPPTFNEDQIWSELAAHGIHPLKMKYRQRGELEVLNLLDEHFCLF